MANQLHSLAIDEVSAVDSPANQEVVNGKRVKRAVVAFYKRDLSAKLWDSEDPICKAVDGPDEGVSKDGKMYAGVTYPKSDFAYTPDDTPSHWKLRLTSSPGGKPDAGIVGAAIAALGKGFRGKKVIIPSEALAGVKAKVRSAWKQANPDKGEDEMPEVIRKGESMTLQEIESKVTKQDDEITALKSERELLKAENDAVLKMSKKERKLYAGMDAEKRKAYMAADTEKRKAMMDAAEGEKKEKAAEDCMDEATKKRFRAAGPIEKAAMIAEVEKKMKAKGKGKDDEDPGEGEPDEDDLEKREVVTKLAQTEDRLTKAEQELASVRKANRVLEFSKRAESDLPNTPGTAVEKGEMLLTLADSLPGGENGAAFKKVFDGMKAADAAYKTACEEVGKSGDGTTIPALKVFEAKVEEISKRENITKSKATEKVMMEHPQLYLDYEHATRQAVQRF